MPNTPDETNPISFVGVEGGKPYIQVGENKVIGFLETVGGETRVVVPDRTANLHAAAFDQAFPARASEFRGARMHAGSIVHLQTSDGGNIVAVEVVGQATFDARAAKLVPQQQDLPVVNQPGASRSPAHRHMGTGPFSALPPSVPEHADRPLPHFGIKNRFIVPEEDPLTDLFFLRSRNEGQWWDHEIGSDVESEPTRAFRPKQRPSDAEQETDRMQSAMRKIAYAFHASDEGVLFLKNNPSLVLDDPSAKRRTTLETPLILRFRERNPKDFAEAFSAFVQAGLGDELKADLPLLPPVVRSLPAVAEAISQGLPNGGPGLADGGPGLA